MQELRWSNSTPDCDLVGIESSPAFVWEPEDNGVRRDVSAPFGAVAVGVHLSRGGGRYALQEWLTLYNAH